MLDEVDVNGKLIQHKCQAKGDYVGPGGIYTKDQVENLEKAFFEKTPKEPKKVTSKPGGLPDLGAEVSGAVSEVKQIH
jgi:hypothetical protein